MAYESAQGINFKFNGVEYTATSLSISKTLGEFNCTSTKIPKSAGSASTCLSRFRPGGLKTIDIKVDWLSDGVIPPTDKVYDLVLDASGGGGMSGATLAGEPVNKKAVCTGLSYSAAAGDLIRGSATFKLSKD